MTFRPAEFAIEVQPQAEATQVRVRGELDMATVGELHVVLRAQQERGRSVLLDLSQVSLWTPAVCAC